MKKSLKQLKKRWLFLLVLVAVLGGGVYAWIYGNVTPEISGDFKIGTMSGLKFIINDESTNLIDLNDAYGISTDSLQLNEVSSVDGKTFFARDTSKLYLESGNSGTSNEIITFRPAEDNVVTEVTVGEETTKEISGDYMDVTFQMLLDYNDTDAADYYIYFLTGTLGTEVYTTGFSKGTNSIITTDGLKSLRACIRASGASSYGPNMTQDSDEYYAIFGNTAELGTSTEPYKTTAVAATESRNLKESATTYVAEDIAGSYYIDYLTGITTWPHTFGTLNSQVNVYSFDDFSINPASVSGKLTGQYGENPPNTNYLFKMNNLNNSVSVTLRIWLEGGSDYCVNGTIVPENAVKMNLYFVAYKIPTTAS